MKKIALILMVFCAVLTSCNRNEDGPTRKEKTMVKEEMTWSLDSILVVYNYQTANEESVMLRKGEGLTTWSYTFYPWKYKFPADLTVQNGMTGEITSLAERYPENYCKYTCNTASGSFISGGYMCYYNDHFCLRGIKADGMLEMRVVEAEAEWDKPVWTIAYNASEGEDYVYEHRVEYYSRVR